MARKYTAGEVQILLERAKNATDYHFIIELISHKKGFGLRLKGLNGEPVMAQETINEKSTCEYMAARIIGSGLKAKYKEAI